TDAAEADPSAEDELLDSAENDTTARLKEKAAAAKAAATETEARRVVGIENVVLDVFSPRWRADLRECRAAR
ncbi:MAG: hypothetical protein U0Q21_16995, partial [Dermatophilaceae bacterium]